MWLLAVWLIQTYSPNFVTYGLLFQGAKIFHGKYLTHFCQSVTKFGSIKGLVNQHLFPEFGELWSKGSHDTMRRHASVLY